MAGKFSQKGTTSPVLPQHIPSSPPLSHTKLRRPSVRSSIAAKCALPLGLIFYIAWLMRFKATIWSDTILAYGEVLEEAYVYDVAVLEDSAVGDAEDLEAYGEGGTSDADTEAYVTFLSSVSDPWYLLSTRLLLYQLRHDPTTADPKRPFVVLTTSQIPEVVSSQLRREGAEIRKVDLLDGFPVPEGMENNHHWKDQYTKLHIFNLTDHSRILYLDNDMLLLRSLAPLWDTPESFAEVAGVGERNKEKMVENDARVRPEEGETRDYLNAGFLMIRPDEETFEELRTVKDYSPFYMEQALLNHYFAWEGDHPWTALNSSFVSHFPSRQDISDGFYSLHAKMWKDDVDQDVIDIWIERVKDMEQFEQVKKIEV